jgi:hypothetical protein
LEVRARGAQAAANVAFGIMNVVSSASRALPFPRLPTYSPRRTVISMTHDEQGGSAANVAELPELLRREQGAALRSATPGRRIRNFTSENGIIGGNQASPQLRFFEIERGTPLTARPTTARPAL